MNRIPIKLQEWQGANPDSKSELRNISFGDDPAILRLIERLRGQLDISERRDGIHIRANSYVGHVDIGFLSIIIEPKIQTPTLINLLRYAFHLRDLYEYEETQTYQASKQFQDLLIEQLLIECRELISRGLQREYVVIHEQLQSPRGRFNIPELVRQGGVVRASLPCIHCPRSTDTTINRVILAGLKLATQLTQNRNLRVQTRRIAGLMEQTVSSISLTPYSLALAFHQLSRLTTAYESALILIRLLMEGMGLSLQENEKRQQLPGFLFDMNRFWENLLSRFLRENLVDREIQDQMKLRRMMRYSKDHNPQGHSPPTLRPDYVVTKGGRIQAILDAKYRDIWNQKLPTDMLYQLAIYALSQGLDGTATILYPTTEDTATPEIIEIHNPTNETMKACVIAQPVHIQGLEQLIFMPGIQGVRERQSYVQALIAIQ